LNAQKYRHEILRINVRPIFFIFLFLWLRCFLSITKSCEIRRLGHTHTTLTS
jgi:hypothetical protein